MKFMWFAVGFLLMAGGYFFLPQLQNFQGSVMTKVTSVSEPIAPRKQLYKWQDEQGTWHFSDIAPNQGQQYQGLAMPKVKNVMPEQEAEKVSKNSESRTRPSFHAVGKNPLETLKNAHKSLEDAKNIEKLLQEKDQQVRDL